MAELLLIEDNKEIASLLCDFLKKDGYDIFHATSGEIGLAYLKDHPVKLVLLDIMLPKMDGFGVCKEIRTYNNLPIIILSARVGKEDKITGLELGADDYIEKPFDIDVLKAKIKAQIRRNYGEQPKVRYLKDGDIAIDLEATTVHQKGRLLNLSIKEFELLVLFLENKGKTLRKEWIFDKIWGVDSFSEPSTLTVHINKLREKIEESPRAPRRIVTIWGVGYKYESL